LKFTIILAITLAFAAVLLIPVDDAFADVPSPITDITVGHPSGTVIEWDMDYNSLCADYGMCYSGFHSMDVYVNKDNHNGFTEKHFSFNESGGTSGEIQLIKEGTYDYKLKLDTTGYSDGNMRIHIDFQYQPNSNLSGGGDFTIASSFVDLIDPAITITELTTDQYGNKNLELSMSGTTNFPTGSWTVTATDNVGVIDSACWAPAGGMDDPGDPWDSNTQSYDFSKITNPPSGQKFAIGSTSISCAAYDAAGNRSESSFRVVVTHDDPTGFVQYIDRPNSFGNTPDSTTKIFYSANSAQGLHLLKPIADLLIASNTQGMLARQAEWTLLDGAITIKDDPVQLWNPGGSFYARMSGDGYDREIAKPLATMLTDANMAGMLERNNPDRSWTSGPHTITISESSGNFAAMVKICSPSGGGTSCQENHVLKPFADMLNESNLNQAMFERSNMKILDAGGPAASAPQSSPVPTPSGPTTASGTFTVTDGTNGGDCTSIGTWDSSSKTCNVTADIDGGIIVGSDGITLNGNSNEFTGWISDSDCIPSCSHNISVHGKNNITIKNFESINSAGSFALAIHSSQYVTVTNNNNLGAAIIDSQHVTMTDNTIKPALQMIHAGGNNSICPSDIEINNNHFEQMGQNTPGMLLGGAAYQDNISCVWYNLNASGNNGSGDVLNFNLNPQSTPTPTTPTPSTNSTSTNSTSTNSTSTTTATPSVNATTTTPSTTTTTPSTTTTTPSTTTATPATPTDNSITVKTNRESFTQGNPIVVFGKVSQTVNDDIISLKISKDGNVIHNQDFKPTIKGDFTKLVTTSGNIWNDSGNYRIDVSYDGASSLTNFFLASTPSVSTNSTATTSTNSTATTSTNSTSSTTPTNNQNISTTETQTDSQSELKISLNKENFKVGETITIRASLDSVVSEQNVAVSVIDPNNKNVVSRTITLENSNQSSLQFKLVDNSISGTYVVKITSLMNGQTISDSIEFTVVSSNSGVEIISIEPTDQQGNPVTTFTKNKIGFVKVVLSADNPINSLVTVNLFDSELTSLGVGSFKTQLSGEHEIILSFFTPEFATIGDGEIYANVFSEWPSVGGIPLTGESSSKVILK